MRYVLQEVVDNDVIDCVAVEMRPLLIGSGRADLVLDGPRVSVRHARMGLDALGPWVRDLGSEHGTHVNGRVIEGRTLLGPDDLVAIGVHLLRVRSPADATPVPGPALLEALAGLPDDLARRLRAEVMADRWEASAWRALVADPETWIDRIDDRDALLVAIEEQVRALGVEARIDEQFAQRRWPDDLDPAVARRLRALQRWVEPLLARAVPVRDLRSATKRFQHTQLLRALRATGGNRARAADRLGVSRQFVYRLLDAISDPSGDASG